MSFKQNDVFYENLKEMEEDKAIDDKLYLKHTHNCMTDWQAIEEEKKDIKFAKLGERLQNLISGTEKPVAHLVKKTCLDGSWYYVHADDCFCDQCMNEVEEAIEGSST